jgi:hypothetical protein
MCEPDADLIGQPQGPTATLGLADGSCPELTPPTDDNPNSAPPPERAHSRELDADVMQTTRMRAAARRDLFFVRVIRCSWFCSSVQRSHSAANGAHCCSSERAVSIALPDGRCKAMFKRARLVNSAVRRLQCVVGRLLE